MAELFMECEEEELEPWQQKEKPIVVDDDDDDELIFMGEILSAKPSSSWFQPATRPATSTLAVQPQPRVSSSAPGTPLALQRPLSGCSGPQEAAKASAGLSQPISRSPSLCRNLSLPGLAQPASRPVATVTAQPITLSRVTPNNTSGLGFGLRLNSGELQCQGGSMVNLTGLSKRPSTSEADCILPKKTKGNDMGDGGDSPELISVQSPNDLFQKGVLSANMKNGAPFPQACPKCNIHFNLLEPLKNHIKYCCPEMVPSFLGAAESLGPWTRAMESEPGKLIMLVNDFYYGQHEGNVQQVRQEQKTHTTFKCASCMKHLKSNVRFMNHMKHHLELEKQNSESWESHTTCQHCFRQFPTPFQLQCHIETTHTPHECSTICKICELSFETEQILLQHMKDNHKPGEMPYVCQVCSYRSSVFSDVDKHFRAVHENTKNLLCPFCLKVIKIGAPYMHHFMRHQKKGVHRCTKCRLQFLTCKEKLEHKSQHHRTFKKPAQLEGLPPGTKVTIRASAGSLQPVSPSASFVSANTSVLQLSPPPGSHVASPPLSPQNRLNTSKTRSKPKPSSFQRKESLANSSSSASSNSSNGGGSKKNNSGKIANTGLSHLRCPDIQKCIECNSDIRTFANHFPAYVRCSLCRYSTSCSKAYSNHMISFHSARPTKRFWMYKEHSEELKDLTLVCLHCDFVADLSAMDKMAAHLSDNETHECQVILENGPTNPPSAAENLLGLSSEASLKDESKEGTQELSRPSEPKEEEQQQQQQPPPPKSFEIKEANKDHLGNPREEASSVAKHEEEGGGEEERAPAPESSPGPELPSDPIDSLEKAGNEDACATAKGEEAESLGPENAPCLPACLEHSVEEGSGEHDEEEDFLVAEGEKTVPGPPSEDAFSLERHTYPEHSSGGGNTEDLSSPADMECEDSPAPSGLENRATSDPSLISEDPTDAGGSEDLMGTAEHSGDAIDAAEAPKDPIDAAECSEDPIRAAEDSEDSTNAARSLKDSISAGGSPEDPINAVGRPEDPISADGSPEDPISAGGSSEDPISAGGSSEDLINAVGSPEDSINAFGRPEDPISAVGIPEDPINAVGSPEDRINAGGSPEDAINAVGSPEDTINAARGSEDHINALGSPEDPINAARGSEDLIDTADVPLSQKGGLLAAGCEKHASSSGPGSKGSPSDPSQNSIDGAAGGGGGAGCPLSGGEECEVSATSPLGPSACGEDLEDTAEEEGEEERETEPMAEQGGISLPSGCEESPSPSMADAPDGAGPSASVEDDPMDPAGDGDAISSPPEDGDVSPADEPLVSPMEAGTSPVSSSDPLEPAEEANGEANWALLTSQDKEDGASVPQADLESHPSPKGSPKEAQKTPSMLLEAQKIPSMLVEAQKTPSVLVEAQKISSVLVEAQKTPSVLVEAQKTPSVLVEAQKISSVLVEAQKTPSMLVEAQKTPSVLLEAQKTPSMLVEAQKIPSMLVEAQKSPSVLVEAQKISSMLVETQKTPSVLVEAQKTPSVLVEAQKTPSVLVPLWERGESGGPSSVPLPSPAKSASSLELPSQTEASSPDSATAETPEEDSEEEGGLGGQEGSPHGGDGGSVPRPPLEAQADDSDEGELADVMVEGAEWASDEDVGFAQFLQRRGEPAVAAPESSEQDGGSDKSSSVRLEPLTPSEVLEHEATEILQKKGGTPSPGASEHSSSSSGGPASPEEHEEKQEELDPEAS
ncbi:zinc finger protein 280D isoform X2 [Anolis sagrei]|uniref:zinc finger protein 280D isoform X2 n=1 Tax=Anolis sagrei TaxID=38937 RepID=UPI003522FFDB